MKLAGLLLFALLAGSEASRILCFFPVTSRSMVIIAQQLMVELAERGHEVTMVSPFPLERDVPNYREVIIKVEAGHKDLTKSLVNEKEKKNIFAHINRVVDMMTTAAVGTIKHPDFQKIMAEEQFDLIIVTYILTTFTHGLAAHFNCPYIILSSAPTQPMINEMLGQPNNPEAVPSFFSGIQGQMTMWQRVVNMGANVAEYLVTRWFDYKNAVLYREIFPAPRYPDFEEVKRNLSLVLVNSHFTLNHVRPFLPSVVEVGGLQIKEKPSPLPEDIKKWVDGAKEGLVLVSFGSNFKSADLPPEKLQIFLRTFGSLKQRVIWKFESEDIKDLPANVLLKKWLPQDDLLAHPNTRLFVSHFGISSYNEALYHAVPAVGVPIAGDQPYNAKKAQDEGWAEVVHLTDLTQAGLDSAVQKVLTDPRYKRAVQKLSNLYRDRPMSALDTAVYWVEYVLRHRGAPQLHYQGADLTLWQKTSLDVWLFVAAWIWILAKGVQFSLRKVASALFGGKSSTPKKSKKTKAKQQ